MAQENIDNPVVTSEHQNESVDSLYLELIDLDPKFIKQYVPTDAAEQKERFLAGEVRNPVHHYGRLDNFDFEKRQEDIDSVAEKLTTHPDANPKYIDAYKESIETYKKKNRLLELSSLIAKSGDSYKGELEREYMKLNIELYGEPDEAVYRQILSEKITNIQSKALTEVSKGLLADVISSVGEPELKKGEKFIPSEKTVEWMHDVAEALYGGMLSVIPEQEEFTAEEARDVFEAIIRNEFGEVADDWAVDVEDATAVNVKPDEKRIIIPRGRVFENAKMRKLTVHEIGVHFLRSVNGAQTDLGPLRHGGLSNYFDAEEGLGSVMEQALVGEYTEVGTGHYVTAGAAYFDQKDFRDTFELKWKLAVLNTVADNEDPTPDQIKKAQRVAYGNTFRIFRGTDTLPWFKDLSYYNGTQDVWRHLEEIRGDDLQFSFVLMGKANAANEKHARLLYETSTK